MRNINNYHTINYSKSTWIDKTLDLFTVHIIIEFLKTLLIG